MPVGPEGAEDSITVLDLTLANFAEVGLTEVGIIVGYRKEAVYERKEALEQKYGVKLTLIDNDKAEEWNNAYSLWCGRDLKDGVILANGDTVHLSPSRRRCSPPAATARRSSSPSTR
ncbi:hypothetical protein SALBM311S_08788 [Streptomyces alboniger]